jgi:hypothetical protein
VPQPLVNFSSRNTTSDQDNISNGEDLTSLTKPTMAVNNNGGQQQQQQQQNRFHMEVPTLDSRNFTLSPETTDCDSADLESEMSVNEGSFHSSGPKIHTAMPVLEDGLSSGHASDLEDDVIYSR